MTLSWSRFFSSLTSHLSSMSSTVSALENQICDRRGRFIPIRFCAWWWDLPASGPYLCQGLCPASGYGGFSEVCNLSYLAYCSYVIGGLNQSAGSGGMGFLVPLSTSDPWSSFSLEAHLGKDEEMVFSAV